MDLRYTIEEYNRLKESLIGSLVSFDDSTPLFGVKCRGTGIVTNARRECGKVYLKIVWIKSPYINFIEERKIGWHLIERLIILQNSKGERNKCLSKLILKDT